MELTYLAVAAILLSPLALRGGGRHIAAAISLALLALSAYGGATAALVIVAVALTLALDWRWGTLGVALAMSAVGAALAMYAYYSSASPLYALLGLFLTTAAVYGLLAMEKTRENVEGAVKYLVFSGVGKLLIVLGLLYPTDWGLYLATLGFMFELGIFPFHAWVVDAYATGSPRGLAALTAFSKVAALYLLLSVFNRVGGPTAVGEMLLVISLLSMFVANVAGLTAKTIGRLMAYSSIAHMSYALTAVAMVWWLGPKNAEVFGARDTAQLAALVVVLEALASGLAKAGIFGHMGSPTADVAPPRKSLLNVVNALSLLGAPPLLGFWPKLLLILLALTYGTPQALAVALWVVINSVLATPYYFRAVKIMLDTPGPPAENATSTYTAALSIALGLAAPVAAWLFVV